MHRELLMSIRRTWIVAAALFLSVAVPLPAQVATTSPTRAHVETLASEKFGGREAGSDGERLAADYIAAQLQRIGARPLPGRRDMLQPFEFTAGSRDGGTTLNISRETSVPGDSPVTGIHSDAQGAVRALSFSDDGDVEGEVVFVGYGIVVPESSHFGYDSYTGLDVKDKIVLVL